MKKVVFTMLSVFLFATVAYAEPIEMDVSVLFKNPFQVSDVTPVSFGEVTLDGAKRTIAMNIDALVATADTLANAQTEAGVEAPKAVITSDGVDITPGGSPAAGYAIVQSALTSLKLQLECTELGSGAVPDNTAMTGDYDISGDGKVVIKSVYTNLDEINAATFDPTAGVLTTSVPLYFAPTIAVDNPDYDTSYSGKLNFTLVLQ